MTGTAIHSPSAAVACLWLESVSLPALQFNKILDPANVKRIVEEADGYQPHLIAPEMGYRRLLQECLVSLPPFC